METEVVETEVRTPADSRILVGEARELLRREPEGSVACCVTSPPYWGLRSYGGEPSVWSADPHCEHLWVTERTKRGNGGGGTGRASQKQGTNAGAYVTDTKDRATYAEFCTLCPGWRGELGHEPTPERFVEHLVEVFREVRRVLRDDGTLWVNLGDSYASQRQGSLKPKDLCGLPWRLALALQDDGWYLRADCIWHKPNGFVTSVQDRPTIDHEYLFLLTKRPRYYYDRRAILEPYAESTLKQLGTAYGGQGQKDYDAAGAQNPSDAKRRIIESLKRNGGRNKRSVWSVQVRPYPGSHTATFPEELITPCILAGCPPGGTVLDPFSGVATTGLAALRNGRSYLGLEINPEFARQGEERLRKELNL